MIHYFFQFIIPKKIFHYTYSLLSRFEKADNFFQQITSILLRQTLKSKIE